MGVHQGSLGSIGGTGTVTVTGIGFEPVAVIFWNAMNDLAEPGMMMGCATAAGEQWVMWTWAATEIGTAYDAKCNEGMTDACILNRENPIGTIAYRGELTGMTSDGFTVDITDYNSTGMDVYYMALGGKNISGAYAGTFTAGASTGTTSVNAPGFRPKALIVGHQLSTWDTGILSYTKWGVGVSDGTNSYSDWAQAEPASTHSHIHRFDEIACGYTVAGAFRMALDSFDSTGFTVDVTDASTGNHTFGYLTVNCAAAAAGSGLIPDSTGTETLSTPGFSAEGWFFTVNGVDVPSTSGQRINAVYLRPGVGGGTLTSQDMVGSLMRDDFPFGLYNCIGWEDSAAISLRGVGSGVDPNATTQIVGATVSATTMGSSDLTFATVQATNTTRAYGWIAFPGDVPFAWIPKIYRRQPY